MLAEIIYNLPEIALLIGILHIGFLYIFGDDKAKSYAAVTRFWLLISVFLEILFYNKNSYGDFIKKDAYSLLFILWSDICIYIMLIFSPGWFSGLKRIGGRYNILLLLAAGCLNIMIKANDLTLLLVGGCALLIINDALIRINYEKASTEPAKRYLVISCSIFALAFVCFVYLWYMAQGQTEYVSLANVISEQNKSLTIFMGIMGILMPLFYALSIVPFHMMAEEKTSKSILPVAQYFATIMPIACWGVFIRINQIFIPTYGTEMAFAYKILALISVIFGAIGASARINLHRIFTYTTMYHFGVVLLLFSLFTQEAEFTAFIYLFVYMIALDSTYMIFYSIKSHGEYLSSVTSLSGLAKSRPYTSGALLVGLFSMIGLPPLAGFLGQLNVVYELIRNEQYISLGFILVFMLLLAKAFLNIIKTIYFDQKIKLFDTENKYVLLYTWFGGIAILVLMFNPYHIIETMKDMFYVLFL